MRWQPRSQTCCMPKWQRHYLTNLKEKHNSFEWNLPPTSVKSKRVKVFFIFMVMLPFKQVKSNCGKKEPCERGCCWIIKFFHWLNFGYRKYGIIIFFNSNSKWLYTLHVRRKKSVKWITYDNNFLKKSKFHFDIFSRRVSFTFKCGKTISRKSGRLKSQNLLTISKLVNLCPVNKIFPYFDPFHFQ